MCTTYGATLSLGTAITNSFGSGSYAGSIDIAEFIASMTHGASWSLVEVTIATHAGNSDNEAGDAQRRVSKSRTRSL